MKLNELHHQAASGCEMSKKQLFLTLSENFYLFVQHRLWNEQDSRDLVQDAMTTIASKYAEMEFETSFSAWAYQVLKNKLLHHYRSKQYRQDRYVPMTDDNAIQGTITVDPELKVRLLHCLKAMSNLNLRHARILNLSYQGFLVAEICERLNISSANCYQMLSRARETLKRCLSKRDN